MIMFDQKTKLGPVKLLKKSMARRSFSRKKSLGKKLSRSSSDQCETVDQQNGTSIDHSCCTNLAGRIRQLEREMSSDIKFYRVPSLLSPYSPQTSSSNSSQPTISISINSLQHFVPTQRLGLSPKILERAHLIPER